MTGFHGITDYWIVKLDNYGNILWQKCLGGTNYDNAYSIQETTGGGYIISGSTQSNNGDVTGNHGLNDYWITKLSYISLLSPNGGELWEGGTNQDITWASEGLTNVSIYYTMDYGSTWNTIVTSYNAASGSYSWLVPFTLSNSCKVMVCDADNPSIYDMSDNLFTIYSMIVVTSPNGGENWQIGSTQNITWLSNGISNVRIEYTTNNGGSWETIVSLYNASYGSYNWIVPNTPSGYCKVWISDAYGYSTYDESDNFFTISEPSQSVSVTNPNGGENWVEGSTHDITWTSSGIENVKIEYSLDNGTSWTTVISYYPASGCAYAWLVPNTPSTQCKVRVSDATNQSTNDLSDNVFTISG